MKNWKNYISLCLSLCLFLGALFVPARAAEITEPTDQTEPVVEETAAETLAEETLPEETAAQEEIVEIEDESVPLAAVPQMVEQSPARATVPLYFQTDYPEDRYGDGTVATDGCGITALSMVATYMTGHEYRADELARYFGGAAENNIARLVTGSETLQLAFTQAENFHKMMEALREGKVAIVLMNKRSSFTTSQHFIVLTGLTEDGRILVNDPYKPNYEKWDLKEGFAKGFIEDAILCGYSGAWIYDKSAMPAEPFIYYKPAPVRGEPRYPDIKLTNAERELLARVVWVESRGECPEGQQAVAEVVLNRLASDEFPDGLEQLIYAPGQFRSVPYLDDADPYQAQYDAIEAAIYGPYVLPEDVVFFATYPVNDNVWGKIGGHIFCYKNCYVTEETSAATEPEA